MKKLDQEKKKVAEQGKKSATAIGPTGIGSESSALREMRGEKGRGHAAGSKKDSDKRKEGRGYFLRYAGMTSQFLREARMEMKKVKWPTRKELLASTAAVIVLVLVVAIYLGLIDFGLIKIIKSIVG